MEEQRQQPHRTAQQQRESVAAGLSSQIARRPMHERPGFEDANGQQDERSSNQNSSGQTPVCQCIEKVVVRFLWLLLNILGAKLAVPIIEMARPCAPPNVF